MSRTLMQGIASFVPAGAVLVLLVAVIGSAAPTARAEVVYQSDDPFGGFFGVEGWDIAQTQSVAVRFVSNGDLRLDELRLWLWSDDVRGGHPSLKITLRDDDPRDGQSRPGQTLYEQWKLTLPETGYFNPELFDFPSALHPSLHAGQRYWVVAESDAPLQACPVWACAQPDPGFLSFCAPPDPWSAGQSGEAGAMIVLGTRVRTPAVAGTKPAEE